MQWAVPEQKLVCDVRRQEFSVADGGFIFQYFYVADHRLNRVSFVSIINSSKVKIFINQKNLFRMNKVVGIFVYRVGVCLKDSSGH